MKRLLSGIIALALVAGVGFGGWWGWKWYQGRGAADAAGYRTAEVKRTEVIASISATGTIVPEDVVDVGTQVNGQVASFGRDTDGRSIDYRSTVVEGQVLATIDTEIYAADVASGEAQLAQANAAVLVAQASRDQARARLNQADRDWKRAQKLMSPGGELRAISQADYDATRSAYEQAVASLALEEAQIVQAQAQVASADASLLRSRRNLKLCTINSPVSGVIIDRRVDIGQTVVSSLNAPSLFLIARDLARMQVLVQVNEADISHVVPGADVTFSADALPGQRFKGKVQRVRLNATMTQNVVTYTVEITTENPDLKLLPYLTANVRFVTDRREQALTVPNAALRWAPTDQQPAAPARAGSGAGSGAGTGAAGQPSARGPRAGQAAPSRVWVLREGQPAPVTVKVGLTDGLVTEIITDELEEGDEVVTGENRAGSAQAAAGSNPFAPPVMGGGRGRGR